jgi:hypothetical protein
MSTMRYSFIGRNEIEYVFVSSRRNPNIEMPTDDGTFPVPPDQEHGPPIERPPDQPGTPENQPDPPPIKEPNPDEPTRLF